MSTPVEQWRWLGRAGHFICARYCQFHMATVIGKYLVSTLGDYQRKEGEEMRTIGAGDDAFFETMVFLVDGDLDCGCCPRVTDWEGLEQRRYATAAQAEHGHMEMCRKYAEAANG